MSEDKIEVGEYIRTINGTIAEIEDDEFDLRYGCFGSIQPFYRYFKNKEQITESIVKHSKNIKELIKVGDIIGLLTNDINDYISIVPIIAKEQIEVLKKANKKYIKFIITKEKLDSVAFKL